MRKYVSQHLPFQDLRYELEALKAAAENPAMLADGKDGLVNQALGLVHRIDQIRSSASDDDLEKIDLKIEALEVLWMLDAQTWPLARSILLHQDSSITQRARALWMWLGLHG